MKRYILAMFLVLWVIPLQAAPNENDDNDKGVSGLPVPRFASLRSGEVNMRMGPGTRYPIAWVYTHQSLPVEIIAEYEIWRRVRDPDGAEGWVHKISLSGKRSAIVTGSMHDLHSDNDDQAPVVAHLDIGAIGQLMSCKKDWCKLKFNGPNGTIKGYMRKTQFWGAYPNEVFD